MPSYAKREVGYFKWKALPATKRTKVSEEAIDAVLATLWSRPGEYAEVSSAVAYHLKERGCEIHKRSSTILIKGEPVKVIDVYARWVPAT